MLEYIRELDSKSKAAISKTRHILLHKNAPTDMHYKALHALIDLEMYREQIGFERADFFDCFEKSLRNLDSVNCKYGNS